ncbi:MAG TPA: hypothetical protein VGW78_03210 [Candidatus Babeliales bacterium]|nr:hypothetical protein [Candidatus Babeliales bacterium]
MKRHCLHFFITISIYQPLYNNFFHTIVQKLDPQYYKRIVASAYKNMPSKLQKCESLIDVEQLLREEENECLKKIKDYFDIPDNAWEKCQNKIRIYMHYCHEVYFKSSYPCIDHSFSKYDIQFFQYITKVLTMYGINPNAVNIVYDQEEHTKISACSQNPNIQKNFYTKELEVKDKAQISFVPPKLLNASNSYTYRYTQFTPFHEGMHLFEGHVIKSKLIKQTIIKSSNKRSEIRTHQSLKEYERMQEKIAEIMPLLMFKNPHHIETLYNFSIKECLYKAHNGQKIVWNSSPANATHPDHCSELLPWILKIKDLMEKEQINKTKIDTSV